jgi:hypothetical protein
MALACAVALLPAAQARADAPPEPVSPSLEQPQATPEPLAPTQQPLEPEVAPQEPAAAEVVAIPETGGAEVAAELPDQGTAPAAAPIPPPEAPDPLPQARAKRPPPPARAKVETLLRRVDRRVGRARSDLHAGRKPTEGSLRHLRQDVQALPPAVVVLERHAATHARGDLDVDGVKRRLRRVLATTGSLVAALARSGIDTPESARLARVLAGLTGVGSSEPVAGAPGQSHAARRAVRAPGDPAALPAYTHRPAAPARSWSGAAGGSPGTSPATDPQSLMRLDTLTASSGHHSVLGIVAVALLLVLAVSNSVSWLVMSRWGLPTA